MNGVLKACEELCGKRKQRDQGNTGWWNEEVQEETKRAKQTKRKRPKQMKSKTKRNKKARKNQECI